MLAALLALLIGSSGPAAPADTPELSVAGTFHVREGLAPLVAPSGVASDALGQVWVTDAAAHRLVRWDAGGAWRGERGALGSEANQFRRPVAITRLGSLGVAVLDDENRRVVAYDHLGRLTDLVVALDAPELESAIGRVTPVALAADRGGALVVADSDRDRLVLFDFSGHFLRTLGAYGPAPGSFHGLAAVAVAAHGELVTLERPLARARRKGAAPDSLPPLARVQWLDGGGTPVSSWTFDTIGAREFALAVDDSGRVAVAIAGGRADAVLVFSRDGRPLAHVPDLASPRAIAFAPDGSLLVAEAGAARVRRYAPAPVRGE